MMQAMRGLKTILIAAIGLGCNGLATAADQTIFSDRFEPAPVMTTFDVTWASGTRLLEGGDVAALIDISSDGTVFTFSTALLDQANVQFQTGNIMVIEGLALRRVDTVTVTGDTTEVTTSQAALNEAIDSGQMSWTAQVGFHELATAQVFVPERGVTCSPDFDDEAMSVTFECAFLDYTIKMLLSSAAHATSVQFVVIKGGDNASASFSGTGVLSNFEASGSASYANGALESFGHDTTDTGMDIKLGFAAAGSGSHSPISYEVPFPVIRIPFTVGPIPMSIDIGVRVAAIMNVPVAAQASATAEVDFRLSTDTGLTFQGGSTDFNASINESEFSNGVFDSAAPIGVQVDAGFGLAFPRVSLNVLTSEVAYIHTGFILESHLFWGPVCKEALAKMVVEGGYKLEILGVGIAGDQTTFAERERREPPDGC